MVFSTKQIKLFFAILSTIVVTNRGAVVSATELQIHHTDSLELKTENIIAKKSGGRSSGGSFKRKPSRSKSSSPRRRSSTKSRSKSYSSPSSSYKRNSTSDYHYSNSSNSTDGDFMMFFIASIFFVVIFLALCTAIYNASRSLIDRFNVSNRAKRKVTQERDNDRITISLLQVVLSSEARELQQDLSNLTINSDTDSEAGLVKLMKETVLILMRNDIYWTHVASNSKSMDISNAESEFDVLSFVERSKFSSESLSNVDGQITTKESRYTDSDGFSAYIVVTLIIGSADDRPVFNQINSVEELQQALETLSGMREDYLMKFELLWTPQQQGEYLTDEELLMEYTEVMPL